MGLNKYSDYGSASSSESDLFNGDVQFQFSLWNSRDVWSEFQETTQEVEGWGRRKSWSTTDVPRTIDAVMLEFRMNGYDSPYDPDQDTLTTYSGGGPSNQYLRQRSWPEAACDRTDVNREVKSHFVAEPRATARAASSARRREDVECRFCKNNGERSSYYRSHRLRTRGRVTCPVLRAYTCARCGAAGDRAHTNKYCPLATHEDRMKSVAMMRSVRMTSGQCRKSSPFNVAPSSRTRANYATLRETAPGALPGADRGHYELDPLWEALERKLMI